jgi:hypothetical protein
MSSLLHPRSLLISVAIFLVTLCATPGHAQAPGVYNAQPGSPGVFGDLSPNKDTGPMAAKMARERNVLRQKAIVDETNQLLDLAKQLKDAVDKSDRDELSLAVVRKAEEIEKLAKDVKTKMRDGTADPASTSWSSANAPSH